MNFSYISQNLDQIVLSFVFLTIFLCLKKLSIVQINKSKKLTDIEKKHRLSIFSNLLMVLLLGILVTLWFSHIQNFIVSFFAISAAFVVATKELIMNLTGGFLVNINGHFKLGDRIEVSGIRGFVIEKNFTTTKVLEIGPEKNSQQTTGDVIIIPNSVMLNQAVTNESYLKEYSIKTFTFKLPKGVSFEEFEEKLLIWGSDICKDYISEAKDTIETFCRSENIGIPNVEPRVRLVMSKDKEIEVLLKLPAKNDRVADLEQDLFRRYVEVYLEKESTLGDI